MDPLSVSASIAALATVVRETVRLVRGVKDGGNERINIAMEVKSLLIVLKSVEGYCETIEEDVSAPWILALHSLSEDGGTFEHTRAALEKLNKTLQPKTGHQKVFQSLRWPILDKSDVNNTLQHVMRLNQSMTAVLEQANSSMTQSIKADTKSIHDALQDENTNAVVEWLSPLNMLAKQASLTNASGEGNGRWLLESKPLQSWTQGERSILWCPGIPGAGKTFLSSIVVQHLRKVSKDKRIGVFVLYCSYNDPQTQSIEFLVAELLKQAIQATNEVCPSLQDLYQLHQKNQTRPTCAELLSQIELAFSCYSKVYLVVDALDEVLQDNARLALVEALWSVKGDVNLMITSRALPTIQQHFRCSEIICDMCQNRPLRSYYHCLECPDWDSCMECKASGKAICVDGHRHIRQFKAFCVEIKAAGEDLESYVRVRIGRSCSLGSIVAKKPGLQQDILNSVTLLAGDRFLLAKFHMDALANLNRPSQVVQALEELPSRIDDTYDQAMRRINDVQQNGDEAKAVLKWVVHAYRPLTIKEIEHATTVYPGQRDFDPDDIITADILCSWCAGLVTIEAGIVKLVHYTAKDYFLKKGAHWFPNAWTSLGQACLTYLSFDVFASRLSSNQDETSDLSKEVHEAAAIYDYTRQFPLLGYASMYWTHYLLKSQDVELSNMAWAFLLNETNVTTLTIILRCIGSSDASAHEYRYNRSVLFLGASALHLASFWGLDIMVSRLLDSGINPNIADSTGLTPLIYASLQGYDGVVDILLNAGAGVNDKCLRNSSALHRAVFHRRENVVEALLRSKDVDVNLREGNMGLTPLSSAIFQGQSNIVARLLAREDLSLNEDRPALIWAAYVGDARIVKLLLDHSKAQLDMRDDCGRTALLNATRKCRNVEVIRVLLEAGANPNIADNSGFTPLLEAMHNGYTSVVKELIDRKKEVISILNHVGGNLIHIATQNGGGGILRLLLENPRELDINAQDVDGRTALHHATLRDLPLAAIELLEFKARTNIKDKYGCTPVQIASNYMHMMMYRILLEADINTMENPGTDLPRVEMHVLRPSASRTILDESQRSSGVLISKGDVEFHDYYLSSSVYGTTCPKSYDNVLSSSVECGLAFNIDENNEDFYQKRSVLQHAVENGDPVIVQTLGEAGLDLNNYEESDEGVRHGTVFLKATNGWIKITELLIKHVYSEKAKAEDQSDSDSATLVHDSSEWKVGLFLVSLSKDGPLWI